MSIDNSLAPSEIRTLIMAHSLMLNTFAQKVTQPITTTVREALLDTVARIHSLVEAWPVEDPPEEPKCGTKTDWPGDANLPG